MKTLTDTIEELFQRARFVIMIFSNCENFIFLITKHKDNFLTLTQMKWYLCWRIMLERNTILLIMYMYYNVHAFQFHRHLFMLKIYLCSFIATSRDLWMLMRRTWRPWWRSTMTQNTQDWWTTWTSTTIFWLCTTLSSQRPTQQTGQRRKVLTWQLSL